MVGNWVRFPMREADFVTTGAEDYRERAQALRKQAEGISLSGSHTSLLFTALYYEKLANQVERTRHAFLTIGDRDGF